MDNNKNLKPITMVRDEFIKDIVAVCNNSGLPFFIVEDVLKNLIQEIHVAAQQQLIEDTKAYADKINKQK